MATTWPEIICQANKETKMSKLIVLSGEAGAGKVAVMMRELQLC